MLRSMLASAVAFTVALAAGVAALAKPGDQKDVIKEPTKMPAKTSAGPLDFTVKTIDGQEKNLSEYKSKVVLFVNVASKCGLTPQYKGLQAVYDKYKDQGFVVVGFPANNFNGQEPGTNEEIKQFCTSKYNVTFPMMSKISVKGDDKHPLYKFLTEGKAGQEFAGDIEWNFAKFLVDRNGNVMARFSARSTPDSPQVGEAIEKALAAEPARQAARAE
jgi:glutathione peroxidase